MKLCLACGHSFNQPDWQCPVCQYNPPLIAGHLAFCPELAEHSDGFAATHFAELVNLEARNFWFRARNRLIIWALQRYFPTIDNLLEIGCGTGFVLSGIEQTFPHLNLYGSEIFSNGLTFAAQRLQQATLLQMDARKIPFINEFDVIGAFDVLEHLKEDEMVLTQLYQATKPNGGILLTVPQHPWLWSQADDYAHHVRRYRAQELRAKVTQAGFKIVRMTSFVSLLLPIMYLSRLRQRKPDPNYTITTELKISGVANTILEKVLDVERLLIRLGCALPAGGSLLLIAKKC